MAATVCIPNIGANERRKRSTFGLVTLGVGLVVAAILVALGVNRFWRLGVALPLWIGAIGYLQAREKT